MRILYLSSWEKDNDGGMSKVVVDMVSLANKEGYDTAILYPGKHNDYFSDKGITNIVLESKIDYDVTIPNTTPQNYKYIIEKIRKFKPDIIHSHTESFIGIIGQIYAIQEKIPYIFTCHILPTQANEWQTASNSTNEIIELFMKTGVGNTYLKNFYKNCDSIIALNEYSINDIKRFGYKGRIYKIPNGRDFNLINSYKKNRKDINYKKLIFVGQVTPRKNQSYIVEVMKYLPNTYSLDLVGLYVNKEETAKIDKIIEQNNLKNITIHGKKTYEEMLSILSNAGIFVSASKNEVQSLAVIEALAMGLPVIGLSNPTIDELINSDNGYIMNKRTSPKEFADVILKINKKDYERFSLSATKSITNLSWDNVIKETIKTYTNEIKLYEYRDKIAERKIQDIINQIKSPTIKKTIYRSFFNKSVKSDIEKIDKKARVLRTLGVVSLISLITYLLIKKIRN